MVVRYRRRRQFLRKEDETEKLANNNPQASPSSNHVKDEDITNGNTTKPRKVMGQRMLLMMMGAFSSVMVSFYVKENILQRIPNESAPNTKDIEEQKCKVYLAPSSLPSGGVGMFTTQNLRTGEMILPSDGPQIPIIDPDYESVESNLAWTNLFSKYWWESGVTNPGLFESEHCAEYQITCGALPNSHVILDNLEISHPSVVPYDDSVLDRMTDPGAGAISNYMGRHSVATVDISAGDEIFLSYPDAYMELMSEEYNLPKPEHYDEASKLLINLMNAYGQDHYEDWKNDDSFQSAQERVQKLLPKSQKDVDRIFTMVTNQNDTHEVSHAIAKAVSVKRRSVDWIRENGLCLDNLVPGVSTNPRAGNGAFAQRFIPKGDVVVPVPLLQISNRDVLRIPAFNKDNNGKWQLLLNYCLGHDDTSLLLCPTTNAILVNHCSHRKPDVHPCAGEKEDFNEPNAVFRWAAWEDKTGDWLGKSIEDIHKEDGRGLSLDIVATRDILQGEEVFVDYGISWEKAWDHHVSHWKPPASNDKDERTNIKELNEKLEPLKVVADFKPYRSIDNRNALFTGCFYYEDDELTWEKSFKSGENWESMPFEEVISRYGADYGEAYEVDENGTYGDGDFWPCVVVRRETTEATVPDEDRYTVRIIQSRHYEETIWSMMKLPRIISNYPRSSIRHFYLPYMSDIHLPGVFRHHIELHDDLIPNQWRNRSNTSLESTK